MSKNQQNQEAQLSELFVKFGEKYHVNPSTVPVLLERTAFKQAEGVEIGKADMVALLVVAIAYDLNPFTREIYAFPDKRGRIVPVVGVDGWARIINSSQEFDGMDFAYSDEKATKPGAQPCHEWVECRIYRKDRNHPVVVREYLDECYRNTTQWQEKTKRMLRHRSVIQCARYAFALTGIYDLEEAESMVEMQGAVPVSGKEGPLTGGLAAAKAVIDSAKESAEAAAGATASIVEAGAVTTLAEVEQSEPLFVE